MRRGLTQQELANRAGVSVRTVRKLEQNESTRPSLETLHLIADALNVRTTSLAAGPDAAPPDGGDVAAWDDVRGALGEDGDAPDTAPTLASVGATCAEAVRLVLASRFGEVRAILPPLLRDAGALVGASGGDSQARLARGRARQLAGYMLGQTWQLGGAADALALALADAAGDPGAERAAAAWLAWARLRGGDLDGCASLASDWADRSEPMLTRATRDEIAAWGRFQILVATVAARDNRAGEAATALRWARAAAVGVGTDFIPAGNPWDVFGPRTVEMAAGEIAVVQGNPGKALRITGRLDGKGFPVPRNWLRSRLDVAAAHAARGDDDDAVAVLTGVQRAAPQWLAQQRGAQATVAVIAGRPKRVIPAEVRALADAVRLPL
jgi:transcriptional regulator with XRE-family HTH domain